MFSRAFRAAPRVLRARQRRRRTSSEKSGARHGLAALVARHEERLLPPLSFIVVAVVWQVLVDIGVLDKTFVASPITIVVAGVQEIQTAIFWGDVWRSVSEFLLGYSAALVVGLAVGMVWGFYRRLGYAFKPWMDALNGIPALAIIPLVLIWVGIGFTADAVIVFVATVVPVVVNMYTAARTVDQRFLNVGASFGSSRKLMLRTLFLPAMTPFACTAARIAVGRAVSGMVIAEFFAGQSGLAFSLFQDAESFNTAALLFGAIVITVLALGAFMAVRYVERRVLRWQVVSYGADGVQ